MRCALWQLSRQVTQAKVPRSGIAAEHSLVQKGTCCSRQQLTCSADPPALSCVKCQRCGLSTHQLRPTS